MGLIESMFMGIDSLMYSAEFWEEEVEENKETFLERVFKDSAETVEIIITLVFFLYY